MRGYLLQPTLPPRARDEAQGDGAGWNGLEVTAPEVVVPGLMVQEVTVLEVIVLEVRAPGLMV